MQPKLPAVMVCAWCGVLFLATVYPGTVFGPSVCLHCLREHEDEDPPVSVRRYPAGGLHPPPQAGAGRPVVDRDQRPGRQ